MSACLRTARYGALPTTENAGAPCPRCKQDLPPHATYCVECDLCILDLVTPGGTAVNLERLQEEGVRYCDASSTALEIDLEDLVDPEPV